MKKVLMKKRVWIPLAIILVIGIAGFWYVNDYYRSDAGVQQYLKGNEQVAVKRIEEGLFLDGAGSERAVIFYPGAKVEYTAYVPLFFGLAEQGVDCFLVKMPCNLAILDQDAAEDIMDDYHYDHWYLSGHSLGGAMASTYLASELKKPDEAYELAGVEGLILLAAYPTKSLSEYDLQVLSVYGSEDGVLNRQKLEEGRSLMPANYTEISLEGGNHAWFGNYGEQEGDNPATISREEQQTQTVEAMLKIMEDN